MPLAYAGRAEMSSQNLIDRPEQRSYTPRRTTCHGVRELRRANGVGLQAAPNARCRVDRRWRAGRRRKED
jgi:hypothetical protein